MITRTETTDMSKPGHEAVRMALEYADFVTTYPVWIGEHPWHRLFAGDQ